MSELGMSDLPPLDPPEVLDESSGIATYYTRDQVIEHMCATAEHVRTILASAAPVDGREDARRMRTLCRLLDAMDDMGNGFPGDVHAAFQDGSKKTRAALDRHAIPADENFRVG